MTESSVDNLFDESVNRWIEKITAIQKESSKRSNISIFLGAPLGIAVSFLIRNLSGVSTTGINHNLECIIGFSTIAMIILVPLILYTLWAKPKKNRRIKNILGEIQQIANTNGWSQSRIADSLVARLPSSNTCIKLVKQLKRDTTEAEPSKTTPIPQGQPTRGISASSSETKIPTWKIWLLYVLSLLAGLVSGQVLCLVLLIGPTIGFLTVQLTKPQPRQAGKRGAIAGTVTAAALLLTRLIQFNPDRGFIIYIDTYLLPWQAVSALYIILFSALTALIIGRHRPARDLEILEYRPLQPSNACINVVCRSCSTKKQIPIAIFSRSSETNRQQLTESENQIHITNSGQYFYDISQLSEGTWRVIGCLAWLLAVAVSNSIIGLVGGGDIIVYVVWNLILVLVIWTFDKASRRYLGRKTPIWLISCPECSANTPVATDGNLFFIGVIQATKEPA